MTYSVTAGEAQFQPLADKIGVALKELYGPGTPVGDMLLLHAEMLEMLKKLEWSGGDVVNGEHRSVCPVCFAGWRAQTHSKYCKLAALIAKAEGR
jgi:hypothetical protein